MAIPLRAVNPMWNHVHPDGIDDQGLLKVPLAKTPGLKLGQVGFPVNAGLALAEADKAASPSVREYPPYHDVEFPVAGAGQFGACS